MASSKKRKRRQPRRAKKLRPLRKRGRTITLRRGKRKLTLPKRKGERWRKSKKGKVTRTRRGPRGEKITSRMTTLPELEREVPQKEYVYAIPYARKVGRGRYRLEWQRWPDYESLRNFMQMYEADGRYPNWAFFVFKEEVSDVPQARRNELLNEAAVKFGRASPDDFGDTDHFIKARTVLPSYIDPNEV